MKKTEKDVNLNNALKLQQYKYPLDAPLVQESISLIKDEIFTEQKYADVFGHRLSRLALEYRKCKMDEYEYKVTPGENNKDCKRLVRKTLRQEDLADRIGVTRQVFVRDLKGFTAQRSKRKDYYDYRRKYLELYSLFFQVSPRYLMGLTDDVHDFGETPTSIMFFENDGVIYSHNLIVEKIKTAASESEKEEIIACLKGLKQFYAISDDADFRCVYAWLHTIPAVSELAGEKFSKEYNELDTTDYKLRDVIDERVGFELCALLKHIDEHDRKVLFLLIALIDFGKYRLLAMLNELLAEGGFMKQADNREEINGNKGN